MSVQVSYKKQILLIVILLVAFLIVVEVLANIWLFYFYVCDFEKNEIFKDVDPETNRKICLESIGYEFTKQEVTWVNGTRPAAKFGGLDKNLVYINSEGFRGPEFAKNKPDNTYRIFILGGSTTFGAGVLDNQTYPYYLGKMYDKAELNYGVEVINVGWPGWWSETETKIINEKLLNFEPDLFIVYDGVNDLHFLGIGDPKAGAIFWKEKWREVCDLGNQYGYEIIITLQPMVGTGNKILTEQEYENLIQLKKGKKLDRYPKFVTQLEELKNHCSLTSDLTGLFDDVEEAIYFDAAHTGPKGNEIIANKMFELSLPFVINKSKNNEPDIENLDPFILELDNEINSKENIIKIAYDNLRKIILPYKTPKVMKLIME